MSATGIPALDAVVLERVRYADQKQAIRLLAEKLADSSQPEDKDRLLLVSCIETLQKKFDQLEVDTSQIKQGITARRF